MRAMAIVRVHGLGNMSDLNCSCLTILLHIRTVHSTAAWVYVACTTEIATNQVYNLVIQCRATMLFA